MRHSVRLELKKEKKKKKETEIKIILVGRGLHEAQPWKPLGAMTKHPMNEPRLGRYTWWVGFGVARIALSFQTVGSSYQCMCGEW